MNPDHQGTVGHSEDKFQWLCIKEEGSQFKVFVFQYLRPDLVKVHNGLMIIWEKLNRQQWPVPKLSFRLDNDYLIDAPETNRTIYRK